MRNQTKSVPKSTIWEHYVPFTGKTRNETVLNYQLETKQP